MYLIRPWLAIGSYRETVERSYLQARQVGALLHLESLVEHPGIRSCYLPVEDGAPLDPALLQRGVAFIREERQRGALVLVACAAGISRSVSFSIAALKELEGLDLLGAYRAIRTIHHSALPHHLLWESLCAYYQEPVPYELVVAEYQGRC